MLKSDQCIFTKNPLCLKANGTDKQLHPINALKTFAKSESLFQIECLQMEQIMQELNTDLLTHTNYALPKEGGRKLTSGNSKMYQDVRKGERITSNFLCGRRASGNMNHAMPMFSSDQATEREIR